MARAGGVTVRDLTLGTGAQVGPHSSVTVHFDGWLSDNTLFFSTKDVGEPLTFVMGQGQVVPGWEVGLQGMRVGGVRELIIPPGMGYGSVAMGQIPANATLRFRVALVDAVGARLLPPLPDRSPSRFSTAGRGLLSRTLREGTGPAAMLGATVRIERTVWHPSGKLLESTFQGASPQTLVLKKEQVTPWLLATLIGMKQGGVQVVQLDASVAGGPAIVQLALVQVTLPAPKQPPRGKRPSPETLPETAFTEDPGGLRYADIREGEGELPKEGEVAICRFTAWADGKPLDSSYDHGKPFAFRVGFGQVILGWDQGVATMRPGGVRQLVIPPHLGYGTRGRPPLVKANSTLVFEIELVEVVPYQGQ